MHPLVSSLLIFGIPVAVVLAGALLRGGAPLRSYIATRIAPTLPMVLILVSVVFFVLRVMPGDVASATLGFQAVQSTVAVFALLVAAISLVVDVVYAILDPRVKY